MNDPHVEFLYYHLRTGEGLKFIDPQPLPCDEGRFTCHLENDLLTVEMREHHASVASARAVVDPFLETWEMAEKLKRGRREMWFEYSNFKMIDRSQARCRLLPSRIASMIARYGRFEMIRWSKHWPMLHSSSLGFQLTWSAES